MIIYPPLIADQIPAFTKSGIYIPFTWNPAVPKDDSIYLRLQIKEYFSSKIIYHSEDVKASQGVAYFTTPDTLSVGRYYKLQIAYYDGDDNCELTYSSAVLGKYIEEPVSVTITNADGTVIDDGDPNPVVYYGWYERSQYNEPLYSYCFNFRDKLGQLLETSGEIIWNNENDIKEEDKTYYVSKPSYTLKVEPQNEEYTMEFVVKTVNNYTQRDIVTIKGSGSVGANCKLSLKAIPNEEEAYIEITFDKDKKNSNFSNKSFYLERSVKGSNVWEQITVIALGSNEELPEWSWRDYSAEIGTSYIYRLRRFRNGIVSTAVSSVEVVLEAEHIYLTDGDRQLKIKYNPKVSSFKTTILEQKTDTIGGKYPFFSRNDAVAYKEIPISGLISYQMDENGSFLTKKEVATLQRESTPTAQSTVLLDEYELERTFKLEVLDWLNNGKPKLFRSAQEGNYIVRLMNVSLSPEEKSSRRMHTFSCTGYECADCTFDNMKELELIKIDEIVPKNKNFASANTTSGEMTNDLIVPYVCNIIWFTNIPYVNPDYPAITLTTTDGQTIELAANVNGEVRTPLGTVYKRMVIHKDTPYSSFSWGYDTDVYNIAKDNDNDKEFGSGENVSTTTWLSGEDISTETVYSNVKFLSIERYKKDDEEDCSVEMNVNGAETATTLTLEDNQIRYYYDCETVKFTTISNAFITICYEEVAENAS